jgi:hypothetical protein
MSDASSEPTKIGVGLENENGDGEPTLPKKESSTDLDKWKTKADIVKTWGTVVAMILGGFWTVSVYSCDRMKEKDKEIGELKRQATAALIEAQKPYLSYQKGLYEKAAEVAGLLTTLKPGEALWNTNEDRFWQLYWSELSVVENSNVEAAMVHVCQALIPYKAPPDDVAKKQKLEGAVYELAHAIRDGFRDSWTQGQPINTSSNSDLGPNSGARDAKGELLKPPKNPPECFGRVD